MGGQMIDAFIIVSVVAFTLFVVVKSMRDKKRGKSSCSGDCHSCTSCSIEHRQVCDEVEKLTIIKPRQLRLSGFCM